MQSHSVTLKVMLLRHFFQTYNLLQNIRINNVHLTIGYLKSMGKGTNAEVQHSAQAAFQKQIIHRHCLKI